VPRKNRKRTEKQKEINRHSFSLGHTSINHLERMATHIGDAALDQNLSDGVSYFSFIRFSVLFLFNFFLNLFTDL
jgi:hypothetical protein